MLLSVHKAALATSDSVQLTSSAEGSRRKATWNRRRPIGHRARTREQGVVRAEIVATCAAEEQAERAKLGHSHLA